MEVGAGPGTLIPEALPTCMLQPGSEPQPGHSAPCPSHLQMPYMSSPHPKHTPKATPAPG